MMEPSIAGFQAAAEEFCALASRKEPVQKTDLWSFRELLLRLIFHIPAVELHQNGDGFDGQRLDEEEFKRAIQRFSGFPFNFYRVVFDPHDFDAKDEPVTGMLADDLADIYRDLAEGLDNARNGHIEDACFEWAQSYSFHWCRHAVHALVAIETYRVDNYDRIERFGGGDV